MNATLLERRELNPVNPDQEVTTNVLEYAEKSLGYKHPEKQRLIRKNELTDALRLMGHKPFTSDSVARYKANQVKKNSVAVGKRFMFTLFILAMCIMIGGIAVLIPAVWIELTSNLSGLSPMFSGSLAMVFVGFMALVAIEYLTSDKDKVVSWSRFPLSSYTNPVPEFALATAQEIHKRLAGKEVAFFIDELVVEEKPMDPFLVAKCNEVEYYLEVWEEPGYKQTRMA